MEILQALEITVIADCRFQNKLFVHKCVCVCMYISYSIHTPKP